MENGTIKNEIRRVANKIIFEEGYEAANLRRIAKECGISLGRLSHYYSKKELLILDIHRQTINFFVDLFETHGLKQDNPWEKYFSIKYVYLQWVLSSEKLSDLYHICTTIPLVKNEYIKTNSDLLLDLIDLSEYNIREWDAFLATTAECGAEFELVNMYSDRRNESSFKYVISFAFNTQLLLLGFSIEKANEIVNGALSFGESTYDLVADEVHKKLYF